MPNTNDATPGILSSINSPDDLRRLTPEQLPQVCADIRHFLIDTLSHHPGHFASGMGCVELTVALHYVFNTPYDRIVWDVGHQAYPHKILTGRREALGNSLRTLGGISGFPTPAESPYDTFSAGHASNSISAALGMAMASRLSGESPRRNVVAVIGDASISGGLAFEGLNNAANTPNNLLIILNDNEMSIDRNVGSLNSYLANLTTSQGYNNLRYKAYHTLRRLHVIDDRRRGAIMRFNNSLKSLLLKSQNIFEGLNIRYFGPFDGNDVGTIVRVLNDIKDMDGPRILHLRSTKGKGYAPAELNPCAWHAPGTFNAAAGTRDEDTTPSDGRMKYQDVFGHTLLELARADKRICAITAAMASGTSVSIMQRELPDRVFDVGISEGHAVTFAGGLAAAGKHPFVAIYSAFLQRAYDNIINDVSIQHLPVTFCIDRAGIVGEDGVTHHGMFDLPYLRAIPGMTVAAPMDAPSLRTLMRIGASLQGPMAIRYPRGNAPLEDAESTEAAKGAEIEIGKGRAIDTAGEADTAILTIGDMGSEALKALAALRAEGGNAHLYDMIWLKPLDEGLLDRIAAKYRRVVTAEDGVRKGGFGAAIEEYFAEKRYPAEITTLAIGDDWVSHGSVASLRAKCGIDAAAIAAAVKNTDTTPQS